MATHIEMATNLNTWTTLQFVTMQEGDIPPKNGNVKKKGCDFMTSKKWVQGPHQLRTTGVEGSHLLTI